MTIRAMSQYSYYYILQLDLLDLQLQYLHHKFLLYQELKIHPHKLSKHLQLLMSLNHSTILV